MVKYRPRWSRRLTGVGDVTNNLQAVVSIGIALLVAVTAIVASQAGGAWQDSVRADVRSSAAMIETVGHVYGVEAPRGFEFAALELRAEHLAAAGRAAGLNGTAAMVEADSIRLTVDSMRRGQKGNGLTADDKYRDESGAYDVVRRLNELQAAEAGGLEDQPDILMRDGDSRRMWALRLAVATVVLVGLYCAVQTVISRRRARTRTADNEAGIVPHPWAGRPDLLKVLIFAAWLLVTLVPSGQIVASLNEQRHQALAARAAVGLSGDIAVSQAVSAFRTNSVLSALQMTTHGLSREYEVLTPEVPRRVADEQTTIARADQSLIPLLEELAGAMGRLPSTTDGTEERTSSAVAASPTDWQRSVVDQGNQVKQAGAAGRQANALQLTVFLAALAFSTGTLARVRRGHQALSLTLATTTLLTTAALSLFLALR